MSATNLAWLYVVIAGCLEAGMALCLGASKGFSRLPYTLGFLAFGIASFVLLNFSLRNLPVGTAYAVWAGIGAAGTALLGIVILHETASAGRLFFLALLIISIIGLKFVSPH